MREKHIAKGGGVVLKKMDCIIQKQLISKIYDCKSTLIAQVHSDIRQKMFIFLL